MPTPDRDACAAGPSFAPPPVVHESVTGHRTAHVWIPGYWDWTHGHYVWIGGHWMPARQGCHWRRHCWVTRDGGWHLEPGGWVLDDAACAPECDACEADR